jgi:DNA-nicking Smr family endonuclease
MSGDDKPPRRLSDDDEALWHTVTRSIAPLKRRRVRRTEPEGVRASARLPAKSSVKSPVKSQVKPPPKSPASPHMPVGPAPKAPPLMPIDRRLKQRLARGQIEIDGRIDLHGRTLSEAHGVLLRFLHRSQGEGLRTVLVITGKGGPDPERGRGVLRRQVPLWLTLPDLRSYVLAVEEAHVAHGGAGALYVRLRRGR